MADLCDGGPQSFAAWSEIIRLAVNSGVNWGEARGSTATAELLTGLKVGFHFSDDKTQAHSGYITYVIFSHHRKTSM